MAIKQQKFDPIENERFKWQIKIEDGARKREKAL